MDWSKGFNFRETSGYVTDPSGTSYVLTTDRYPTSRNSVNMGFVGADGNCSNRTTGNDARLAGICLSLQGSSLVFQIELPQAGDYIIRMAAGDAGAAVNAGHFRICDGNTSTILATIINASASQNTFYDATGVNRAAADWESLNQSITLTFSTTTFLIDIGYEQSTYCQLAHIYIEQASSGGSSIIAPISDYYRRGRT